MLWNLFCKVVDNYGDIGVCWRLSADLAARGETVRLWVDDPLPLAWMAPHGQPGVEVRRWTTEATTAAEPGDVVVEAFGCELDAGFVAGMAEVAQRGAAPVWINLEYLSAEPFVERAHGLPSPVLAGPGAGLTKHFFYPGFTERTGGLLREPGLAERQQAFGEAERAAWLARLPLQPGPGADRQPRAGERLVSLFCYEPPALAEWLQSLAQAPEPVRLLVAAGRPAAAVQAAFSSEKGLQRLLGGHSLLSISYLPWLEQHGYDKLLWSCSLNFVRGEDSLVRALWAGRPFVWHIYPQHDGAHRDKLLAFLERLGAPDSLRRFSLIWNGLQGGPLPQPDLGESQAWQAWALRARQQLLVQDELCTRLLQWVRPRHEASRLKG